MLKKTALGIILILFVWMGYSFFTLGSREVPTGNFFITKGDTLSALPEKLDISVNATLYKIWLKTHENNFVLQAGSYHIPENTTIETLFSQVLSHPLAKDLTITILPGWNIYDIDAYLAKNGIIKT